MDALSPGDNLVSTGCETYDTFAQRSGLSERPGNCRFEFQVSIHRGPGYDHSNLKEEPGSPTSV